VIARLELFERRHRRRVGTRRLGHRCTDLFVVVVGTEPRPVGSDDGGNHPGAERAEPALDLPTSSIVTSSSTAAITSGRIDAVPDL